MTRADERSVSNDVLLRLNRESDIHKQLSACVQGEIKPSKRLYLYTHSVLIKIIVITQCCVDALYKMGKEYQAVVDIAKTFERRRCNHRDPIPADDCLNDMIGTFLSFLSRGSAEEYRDNQQTSICPLCTVENTPRITRQRPCSTYHPFQPASSPRPLST